MRARQLDKERLEFRNNLAIAGWVFMAIWTGILCLFTYIFMRDGGFRQYDPAFEWATLGLFWLFGLGGCSYFFGTPRYRVIVAGGQVTVREAWLMRKSTETFPLADLAAPELLREKDSEGDPYFRCRIKTPLGHPIIVSESNDEETVISACRKLSEAMGKPFKPRSDSNDTGTP